MDFYPWTKTLPVLLIFILNAVDNGLCIFCYKCHSVIHGDQCINLEKIDAIQRSKYLFDCRLEHEFGDVNITMCRKLEQTAGDELRVIRSCAYRGKNRCFKRTGTNSKIRLTYCECNKDGCNKGSNSSYPSLACLSVVLTTVYTYFFINY